MEAVAKHDFNPGNDDELGFSRGDVLKVLCMEEDPAWYKAELDGREGYIPYNYIEMRDHSWYVPNCLRTDAEERLLSQKADGSYLQPDGAFLVRRSETSPQEFSLSVKFHNSVQHFKVLRDNQGKYFLWVYKFDSLNQLIDYHRTTSISRNDNILLVNMSLTRQQMVKALFDFNPQDPDELAFRVGDIIQVIGMEDPHWWRGQLDGRQGVFPLNHVQQLQ